MTRVLKYNVEVEDFFEIEMPKHAKILSVQTQNDKPQLWALVDSTAPAEKRFFRLAGTGHEIEPEIKNNLKFIGTFQLHQGAFVGHLFEVLPIEKVIANAMGNSMFGVI